MQVEIETSGVSQEVVGVVAVLVFPLLFYVNCRLLYLHTEAKVWCLRAFKVSVSSDVGVISSSIASLMQVKALAISMILGQIMSIVVGYR